MDTERRMTTQEMLTQHKKLMDEAQRLEPSVMVTERNWSALLEMQDRLFQQQRQLEADLKTLLTKQEAQEALTAMQASATEFAGQAGSLSAEYYPAAKGESWKLDLMRVIDECMRYAASREEFLALLRAEGYGATWTDSR